MAYTSGRTVKSSKTTQPAELTVAKATAQVRRLAAKHLPGALVSVNSRTTYDLEAGVSLVVTVVTFPEDAQALGLWCELESLSGLESREWGVCRMTITRSR